MKHLFVAAIVMSLILLCTVSVQAQDQFGNDDVNITGIKVGNDLVGDNYSIITVKIPKPKGKFINLQVIAYGKDHLDLHDMPLNVIIVLRGTHTGFDDPDFGSQVLIRAIEFDWMLPK
jgi:hypothetical protein